MKSRIEDFPTAICKVGVQNSIVASVFDQYASGQILTKEEAYARMVVALHEAMENQFKGIIKSGIPATVVCCDTKT